jgi:uncharacterized protein (TIRG00374 family)
MGGLRRAGRWLGAHLKRRWQIYFGLAISVIFLYPVVQEKQFDQVWGYVQQAQYVWILPGVAVYFFGVWARTWRWHYMLRPIRTISLRRLFPVVCIGYMGNNIYPYRAGEVLRAYVLRREEGVSISASLATVVAERIFDGIVMLLFVFIGLPLAPGVSPDWRRWVILFTCLFFGALLIFFLIAASPRRTQTVYNWLIERIVPRRFREPVRGVADRFVEGLRCLRSPRDLGMIFVTSVVIWLAETAKYWFVMQGFPFDVPFYVLMLMNGVVNLFTTIPSAPGYIGTFDRPGIEILESSGVQGEIATAYTLVLHAALWLPITALGAFYMVRKSLSWREVQQEIAEEQEAGEVEGSGEGTEEPAQ